MRIASGVTDQYIYFVAVDATDFTTRETGLTTWTVYRSRNGGTSTVMTTPTINETDVTNMPGVYELLLNEDMTITTDSAEEEMVFHITHAGMAPVTRAITLFMPTVTEGRTLGVAADGDISGNVDGAVGGAVASVTAGVTLDYTDTLPGSPTADTVGDALKQATREEAPKRGVALNDIPFYLVSSTDHVTPVTSASVTEEVAKDGAVGFSAATGTTTEIGNGVYGFDASPADMTADQLVFKFTAAGADPVIISMATVD